MPKFSKTFSTVLCAVFALLIIAVFVFFLALPKETFSEEENRFLATLPSFSAEALAEGSYTERLSAYVRDHLPARNLLLEAKCLSEITFAGRENNRVIVGRNGYLIKRFSYDDQDLSSFSQNITAANVLKSALARTGKPAVFLCAPRAIDVLAHDCPFPFVVPQERSVWTLLAAKAPDALTATTRLREKAERNEAVWFHTDHHWTPLGAYYVYQSLGTALHFTPTPREAFYESTVSHTFLGTSASACRYPFAKPDTVWAMRYEGDCDFICTDAQTGQSFSGFYVESALAGKNQYEYYLGANIAHLRIHKKSNQSRPSLLVIKDSYANCMVPFLARHFDIELLDLRYFRTDATDTVNTIINDEHYAGTLILCNADSLTSSIGFEKIDANRLYIKQN